MADICTLPLIGVENNSCVATPLGKQPVMVLYQDMAGTPPDLTTVPGSGTDPRLSALQAALTDSDEDQVFLINNLAGGTIGAASDQTISGNDVPRGGTLLIGRDNALAARVDYLSPAANLAMNDLNKRNAPVRAWYVDELDYVHGPIENARLVFGNIQLPGIGGTATTHRAVSMTWRGIEEPVFAAKPLVGIAALVNA